MDRSVPTGARSARPPQVAVGPDPGRAGPRARSTSRSPPPSASARPPRSGCAWPAPGRPPRSSRRIAYRKHVRLARLEGGALGVGGIVTAAPGPGRAPLDPEPDGLLHRRRATATTRGTRCARPSCWRCSSSTPLPRRPAQALDGVGKHLAQAAAERALRSGDRTGLHLQARQVHGQAADPALRRAGSIPADRRADRRDAERRRHEGARASGRSPTTAAIRPGRRPGLPAPLTVADSSETRKRTTFAIARGLDPLGVVGVGLGRAVGGRVDHARQDRVGAHSLALVLGVERLHEREQRRLARDVAGGARRTAAAPRARRPPRRRRRRARPGAASPRAREGRRASGSARPCARKSAGSVSCTSGPELKPPTRLTTASRSSTPATAVGHAAVRIGQVGADQASRDPPSSDSIRSRSRVHDPGELAAVPGVEQLVHDGGAERPRSTGHEDGHVRSCGAGGDSTGMQAIPSEFGSTLALPMEQPTLTPTRCFVRDFVDGQDVDEVFVVRGRTLRQKRNGDPFLKLQLGDLSGSIEAVMWDGVEDAEPVCAAGTVVRVAGPLQRRSALRRRHHGPGGARRRRGRVRPRRPHRGAADPVRRRWPPTSRR